MDIVQQIHNEIDSAQERLLNEALEIIAANTLDSKSANTADRLKRLGFVNTEVVRESSEKEEAKKNSVETAKLVEYYKKTYPFLKFLTVSEMVRICEKYNLIYSNVSNYVRDVPEKNITEIENAQPLRKEDQLKTMYRFNLKFFGYVPKEVREFFKTFEHDEFRGVDDSFLRKACPIKYDGMYLYKADGISYVAIDRSGLYIAAPKSHFNLDGTADMDGNKRGFINFTRLAPEPKDPIVFRYVRGGVQVLSKWGPEAEDESLINPINN